jgi:tetratricopeptide (TPR) repeat protein
LYSPAKDGPSSLIPAFTGDPSNTTAVYSRLMEIEPNVAQVALSLIPGSREQFDPTTRSFASDILISVSIPTVPYKRIETAYAEKLLKYKDIIEVEYSANYMDNDALVKVIKDPSGIFFVHYSIEPKKLSIEQSGSKFTTALDVSGMVTDPDGKTIYQFKKSFPLEFNADQVDKIKSKLFSSQDMFPLIEGSYKFSLLMKNTVSKEFTSIEKDITVANDRSLQMSPLILAYKALKNSAYQGHNKPFLTDSVQLVPSPRNDFSRLDDRLYLFFQVYGLEPELRSNGFLEFSLFQEKKTVQTRTSRLDSYRSAPNFLEEFDISDLPPATYSVKVVLLDKEKNPLLEKEEYFFISYASSVPRPWVLSQVSPAASDPVFANILGNQYLNKQEAEQALSLLEKAHQGRPENLKFALDYARALFLRENYVQAKDVLMPYTKTDTSHGELFGFLGSLYQKLGNFKEAVIHYKESLKQQGTNLNILNAIGECYYKLGNNAEALIAWEKSLEINPKQEEIGRLVQSLKKS